MTRVSRRTKRRTNRKKNRSIKRDLERYLRKTIERSIKKSLNKFNKRIKKHKKKKTKKKKIQRGGAAGRGTGQFPGPPAGSGGLRATDATSGSGTLLEQASTNIMRHHAARKSDPIDCENSPDELREYIQTTPAMVINSLRVNESYTGPNDEKTIMDYLKGIPEASQPSFYKIYSQGVGGYNTFICNQYFRLGLDKIEAQRIQGELIGLNENDKATMIQAAFRGWAERNKLDLERKQEEAARTIQAAYRGHTVRQGLGEQPEPDTEQQQIGRAESAPARIGTQQPPPPPPPEPPPAQQPQQPPKTSCLPNTADISRIRERIQECDDKLKKCEEEKAALEKQLNEITANIAKGKGVAAEAAMEALRRQLEKCKEDLEQCNAEKQALEAQIEELKRREQDLLKARLCSLLAEIRINKLVTKKPNSEDYVDNNDEVNDDLKHRLELPGRGSRDGLFNLQFNYGDLIIMLVTACLLAGVIEQEGAIDILSSEDLLNTDIWLVNNNRSAVTYLNSLNVLDFEKRSEEQILYQYNLFISAVARAARAAAAQAAAAGAQAAAAGAQAVAPAPAQAVAYQHQTAPPERATRPAPEPRPPGTGDD